MNWQKAIGRETTGITPITAMIHPKPIRPAILL